jgi:hypothetical protein
MAKGQRSNREHKKPKQLKEKPTPAGSLSVMQPKLTGTLPAKKK